MKTLTTTWTSNFVASIAFVTVTAFGLAMQTGCGEHDHNAHACDHADTYSAGMTKSGTNVDISLLSSVPGPPAQGDNVWTILVTDKSNAPVDGLTITATPWMPDHGHGSEFATVVTAGTNPGEYVLDPVNFTMAGYWEVTIEVNDGATINESFMFMFCI